MNLEELSHVMALKIQNNGLKADANVSQVSPTSYKNLANINACGFLTTNSQDACDTDDMYGERPYVTGFVTMDTLNHLQNWCEKHLDFVLVVHIASEDFVSSSIPVTIQMRSGKCTRVRTRIHFAYCKDEFSFQKEDIGLKVDETDAHYITIVDLRFNYNANTRGGLFQTLSTYMKRKKTTTTKKKN